VNLGALELELNRCVRQFGGDVTQETAWNEGSTRCLYLGDDFYLRGDLVIEDR